MKRLFDGKCTMLKDPTPERCLALVGILEAFGFTPYTNKDSVIGWIYKGSTIAVNYYSDGATNYTTCHPSHSYVKVSFEEFVIEIIKPEKPTYEVITLSERGITARVCAEYKGVTLDLGYMTKEPVLTFEDIDKIKAAMDRLKQ